MKIKWTHLGILLSLSIGVMPTSIFAKGVTMPPQVLAFGGKTFTGFQDTQYQSYDQLLREFLVKRIDQKFGIALDPKKYSGFDLLEIEALFKCKKSNESFDMFLEMFPRQ